jgi:hypothetical protein
MKMEWQNLLWWAAGADIRILKNSPSSWVKYNAIGLSNLTSSLLAAFSILCVRYSSLGDNVLFIFIGLFYGGIVLLTKRAIVYDHFYKETSLRSALFILPNLVFALYLSISISLFILFGLFHSNIITIVNEEQSGLTYSFLDLLVVLDKMLLTNRIVYLTYFSLVGIILSLELIPTLLSFFSSDREYRANLEQTDKNIALKLKRDQDLQLKNAIERLRKENKRLNEMELDDKTFEKELWVKSQRRAQDPNVEINGLRFYIDYHIMSIKELYSLFAVINRLYISVYQIVNREEHTSTHYLSDYQWDEFFSAHPEDLLVIDSIETGNSINFDITTGWKPRIEIQDDKYTVYLPKGAMALLVTGFIIMKLFDYGISNYKQILEIEKLKGENEVIKMQLQEFHQKLDKAPEMVKTAFQEELVVFYNLTTGNHNFKKVKLNLDSSNVLSIENNTVHFKNKLIR